MSILLKDLQHALRALANAPAFTVGVVLSLAIGIGANTAIFSIVDGLLLRPLPYADTERLVILWNRSPGLNITEDWFSTAQYFDIKNGHRGFEQVAIAIGGNYNLTGSGDPERVGTIRVSSGLLSMLGQRAALGRIFVPDEDLPGRTATAVLSYGTWARRFGSDPSVLSRKIILNGLSYEVVGVMPRSFSLPREVMPTKEGSGSSECFRPSKGTRRYVVYQYKNTAWPAPCSNWNGSPLALCRGNPPTMQSASGSMYVPRCTSGPLHLQA